MNPALEALKTRFRARCAGDRGELAALVAAGDAPGVRMLAHKVAGAAGTFGFDALSEAALLVEGQAAEGRTPDPELIAVLDGLLASVSSGALA